MLSVPPNTPVKLCVQVDPSIVGGNQVVARVKDSDGNELARVTLSRLADTMLYCGDYTTPSEEKVLGIDYRIEDSSGNLVEELPDELLIVSSESLEALVRSIKDTLENQIKPDVAYIRSKVDEIANSQTVIESKLDEIKARIEVIEKWVKYRRC